MKFWNGERLELLRKFWEAGDSADAIAAEIPGASRCSVLGARKRYNLPMRRPNYSHPVPRPRSNSKTAERA